MHKRIINKIYRFTEQQIPSNLQWNQYMSQGVKIKIWKWVYHPVSFMHTTHILRTECDPTDGVFSCNGPVDFTWYKLVYQVNPTNIQKSYNLVTRKANP